MLTQLGEMKSAAWKWTSVMFMLTWNSRSRQRGVQDYLIMLFPFFPYLSLCLLLPLSRHVQNRAQPPSGGAENPFGLKTPNDALPQLWPEYFCFPFIFVELFIFRVVISRRHFWDFHFFCFAPHARPLAGYCFDCAYGQATRALLMQSHLNVLFNGQLLSNLLLCPNLTFFSLVVLFGRRVAA